MRFFIVALLAYLVVAAGDQTAPKEEPAVLDPGRKEISEMNINLPVCTQANCRTAKHELFASDGCYNWEISHPHIIKMTEGRRRGSCVDSVFLEPAINRDSKTLVSIRARDISSGLILES